MAIAIDKPSKYFNTVTYTGNNSSVGATRSITNVGFKPDLVWYKNRTNAYSHSIYDAVRGTGVTKDLSSNSTDSETGGNQTNVTRYGYFSSFDTDGFTLTNGNDGTGYASIFTNENGSNFVSWNWLGSNTTVSNTAGSISSTVSANTTSGFSIVSYTGNATAGATVGHGLGVVPKMIILKRRTGSAEDWYVYHGSLANTEVLRLNLTNAKATRADFNNTTPTSSVFTINSTDNVNASGSPFIAYCFAEVKGFSKFGSYTGNGSLDGTFIYTGFSPAFVMFKRTDSADQWTMMDNKRATFNVMKGRLYAESSSAEETTYNVIDFCSNGIKLRLNGGDTNGSGGSYIYMCFASSPFVSSKGIPCTAR